MPMIMTTYLNALTCNRLVSRRFAVSIQAGTPKRFLRRRFFSFQRLAHCIGHQPIERRGSSLSNHRPIRPAFIVSGCSKAWKDYDFSARLDWKKGTNYLYLPDTKLTATTWRVKFPTDMSN